jgi:outer membrane protein TolC
MVYKMKINSAIRFAISMGTILMFLVTNTTAQGVPTYSLDSLQAYARNRYLLTRQLLLQSQFGAEAVRNVYASWLPGAKVTGSATYQSEITALSLPVDIPIKMEEGDKDHYKVGLELSQVIFDGGVSGVASRIEKLNSAIESEKIEAEMLKVEMQVNDLFEGVLVNVETRKILQFVENDLRARESNLNEAVANGMALKSTLLELLAEIAGIEQKQTENLAQKRILLAKLSLLTCEPFDTSTMFVLNTLLPASTGSDYSNRPEYRQFNNQREQADWRVKQINRASMPKLVAFGNVYFGRPGYNMMKYDFRDYWMAGVGLSWNIGGLYNTTNQKSMARIGKQMAENQQDLFTLNMKVQDEQFSIDREKLNELIAKDTAIVSMRNEVSRSAAVQFENGSITLTDYVQKITDEGKSMANLRIHEIQRNMLIHKYKTFINQ